MPGRRAAALGGKPASSSRYEVRSVAADDLWLSMASGRDSIGLHMTWRPLQAEVEALLPVVEQALAPFAPRPHWGKLFADQERGLARAYPRLGDFRALVGRLDPRGTRVLEPGP